MPMVSERESSVSALHGIGSPKKIHFGSCPTNLQTTRMPLDCKAYLSNSSCGFKIKIDGVYFTRAESVQIYGGERVVDLDRVHWSKQSRVKLRVRGLEEKEEKEEEEKEEKEEEKEQEEEEKEEKKRRRRKRRGGEKRRAGERRREGAAGGREGAGEGRRREGGTNLNMALLNVCSINKPRIRDNNLISNLISNNNLHFFLSQKHGWIQAQREIRS
ncbi:hypothetical protein WMY93_007318 [Mugilogobius chulae]|uniref:Galectin n=1 Tax=Mugilogobius chulae TaxID=88201 RepID=A0AAW0PCL6_9GOBI